MAAHQPLPRRSATKKQRNSGRKALGQLPRTLAAPSDSAHSIVGVGASAGGLGAFKELLSHLDVNAGFSYVLVQHLDPEHESILPQLLARATSMPVEQITNGTRVQPNHVYVIPPNATMVIAQGVLKLAPRDASVGGNRSIDIFLQSLAKDQAQRAIGVILSGTASDGVQGLEAIKAEGGITFAQDEKSADFDGMPHNAVAAGCVDFVLSPANIAKELSRLARHPYLAAAAERDPAKANGSGNGLKKIKSLLHTATGVDFGCYKPATIERRIARRMLLCQIKTPAAYAAHMRRHPEEVQRLYQDALINVTSFFRDPEAYEILKRQVFPKLVRNRRGRKDQAIRIWVVGCSTGQEAYSIAMAFMEYAGDATPPPDFQVFATDLNEEVLHTARGGFYSRALVHDVSAQRLRRFLWRRTVATASPRPSASAASLPGRACCRNRLFPAWT